MSKPHGRRILGAIARVALVCVFACAAGCVGKSDGARKEKHVAPGPRKDVSRPGESAPLSANAYDVISPKVLGPLSGDPALKALRKRGILKIAAQCDRPRMCTRMNYGVATGFEVELMRKLAEGGLGVKVNVLNEGAEDADVRIGAGCGAAGGRPEIEPVGGVVAVPYFYSARSGWLCVNVLRGGQPVAEAIDRVVKHFYMTGTFQQIYKNWFVPEAPDVEVRVR